MSKSLDSIVVTLGMGVAEERAKSTVQSYQDLKERVQFRARLYEGLQYIEGELQTLRRIIQSLPSLPPEREVLWANSEANGTADPDLLYSQTGGGPVCKFSHIYAQGYSQCAR